MPDIEIRDWTKLGSIIRSERRSAGLTQDQLARRAGTSRSWLAKIERGHRGAEFEQIMQLLNALDLTMVLRPSSEGRQPNPEKMPWSGDEDLRTASERTRAFEDLLLQHLSSAQKRRQGWQQAETDWASSAGSLSDRFDHSRQAQGGEYEPADAAQIDG